MLVGELTLQGIYHRQGAPEASVVVLGLCPQLEMWEATWVLLGGFPLLGIMEATWVLPGVLLHVVTLKIFMDEVGCLMM